MYKTSAFQSIKNTLNFHLKEQRKTKLKEATEALKASRKLNKFRKSRLGPHWESVTHWLIYLGFVSVLPQRPGGNRKAL